MKKLALIGKIFLLFNATLLAANKDDYSVSLIPDSMLQGAGSVVRHSETILDVTDPGKAQYRYHKIITVLNDAGAHELSISLYYDQFRKVKSFKAVLYDKDGKVMNKRGLGDMTDYAAVDGFSLFNDSRVKHLVTNGGIYPVTIDFEYTIVCNGLLDYGTWYIQDADQSVMEASFEANVPNAVGLKYKSLNTSIAPGIATKNFVTTYSWFVSKRKAIKFPSGSYEKSYFAPRVELSPGNFEIAGYKGSWASWKTFGRAVKTMWKNTAKLPAPAVEELKALVKNAHGEREKAELVYGYLQKNFRYVSVQIGIGGWIPFDAATVHSNKYGDCKALSNYICAAYNELGIKAFPALINAGASAHPIDTSFPSNYFNHAILYAELKDGPLWLECTSNSLPFGELGTFTENRFALVLDNDGGRILKTPESNSYLNSLSTVNTVQVQDNLKGKILCKANIGGEFRGAAKNRLVMGTEKEHEAYVFNNLNYRRPDDFHIMEISDTSQNISFSISGNAEKIYDFKTGNKIFLPSSMIKSWYENITADSTALRDLIIGFPFTKTEELSYQLPSVNKIELPAEFTLNNSVINFTRRCKQAENKVTVQTELAIKKNIIPAAEITMLRESLQILNKYLQQKVIVELK